MNIGAHFLHKHQWWINDMRIIKEKLNNTNWYVLKEDLYGYSQIDPICVYQTYSKYNNLRGRITFTLRQILYEYTQMDIDTGKPEIHEKLPHNTLYYTREFSRDLIIPNDIYELAEYFDELNKEDKLNLWNLDK
jgi:hypothetical protein